MPRRAPLLLALLASLLAPLLVLAGPQAQASRASESSGRPDPALGAASCRLMGRVPVAGGCSRTRCLDRGDVVRRSPNAETCLVGGRSGPAYGTEIDARTCAQLHRRFVAPINLCATNPHRRQAVTPDAPQCRAPFTTYVVTSSNPGGRATRREVEDRWDACLRPGTVRSLERRAQSGGQSLRELVVEATRTEKPGDAGPTVLVVGDSLTWRGTDELARRRPGWVVDGSSGRNLRDLGPRIARFRATHGDPTGLVVALGTNPAPGFGLDDLRQVVGRLPAEVPVMVVTPYRERGPNNPALQVRAVDRADGLLRELAATRPLTCIADWREDARAHPRILVDGTHQTRADEARWAKLVSRSWDACEPL